MTGEWLNLIQYSFQSFWIELIAYLPQLLVALVVLVLGWIVGGALGRITTKLFDVLRVNALLRAAGAETVAARAGYTLNGSAFLGTLIKWLIIVVFFVAALDILGLEQVTIFFRDVVLGYLPQVIVAVLILFGVIIIASVVDRAVVASTRASGFTAPELLGAFARYAIILFGILTVMDLLRIGAEIANMLFAGIVFALALAFGLAFGLGGREAAAKYLEEVMERRKK